MTTQESIVAEGAKGAGQGGEVERARLVEVVDRYLDALATNDPLRLRVGSNVRFTENGQQLALGKGLWGTATATPPARRAAWVADPDAGQVGALAEVGEAGERSLLAVRLKVHGGVISEIETMVCRPAIRIFDPDGVGRRGDLDQVVPQGERSSREGLAATAQLYFEGILRGDGKMIPMDPRCVRMENGVATALNTESDSPLFAMSIADAIDTGIYVTVIESVRDRRVTAVDVERGLVFVHFAFDHPGAVTRLRGGSDGGGTTTPFRTPSSLMGVEIFKVRAGRITHIEAVLTNVPYGMPSGWS
ncbi:MAG: hypothetical protein J2O39_03645 [Acidimicrobiales bacterium]|nr:hypothetical protein [Acidimicrobiales bacterium]MBO0893449.1 hypothetical protein [Acidimicrobiales bacterium]